MFSSEYPGTREERIECGRRIIEQMKQQNLREKRQTKDFMLSQDKDVQKALSSILSKIQKLGVDVNTADVETLQKIFDKEKDNFRKKKIRTFFKTKGANIPEEQRSSLEEGIAIKIEQGIPLEQIEEQFVEEVNAIESQINKIEEFGVKMLRTRSSVVYEVTSKMKEFFINDLIGNSQNSTTPQLSNAGWDMFFRAKALNYSEFVKSTNWNYQTQEYPEAAMELVEECADSLVKSGAIRNKFYDPAVREHVVDQEALQYMKTQYRPESVYTSYRKEHGIGDLKALAKPSKGNFTGSKEQHALIKLFGDLYSYVQNEDKVFAVRYENTFNAIKTRVTQKINNALTVSHQSKNSLYRPKSQEQIEAIRQEVEKLYGTTELTSEQREKFISQKIQSELKQMEKKMAIQLSTDYLAGMTDRSFAEVAIQTGHLSPEVLKNGVRGTIESEQVNLLLKNLKETEGKKVVPSAPTAPAGADDGR